MVKPRILVVGSMNMDLMVYGVPKLAEYGESLLCGSYNYLPGGKGANQAVAAAKLGASTAMVGCLGDDANGHLLLNNLQHFGVDTQNTLLDPAAQTGLAAIMVDKATGRYVCYVILGGNGDISPQQVANSLEQNSYDMVLMQLEMPLETVYRTYELARDKNIPVFLDAGPAMDIPLQRLQGIFILSPNEAETKALTGIDPATDDTACKAAQLLYQKASPQYVLLKLGERGALLYDGTTATLVPCFHVNAIDSTAAGDTFGAAFAAEYCRSKNMLGSIRYAHAAAGLCVSRKGAQASIPTRDEVNAFLQTNQAPPERVLL